MYLGKGWEGMERDGKGDGKLEQARSATCSILAVQYIQYFSNTKAVDSVYHKHL